VTAIARRGLVRRLLSRGAMRLAWIAVMILLPIADAAASPACSGPWASSYHSPQGCPVTLFARAGTWPPGSPPLEVWRNGEQVATMVTTTETAFTLDVRYTEVSCTDETVTVQPEPFIRYDVAIDGAEPGDELVIESFGAMLIDEPGPCVDAALPVPECYASYMPCPPPPEGDELDEDEFDVGPVSCSTGSGAAGLPIGLALLALLLGRRRAARVLVLVPVIALADVRPTLSPVGLGGLQQHPVRLVPPTGPTVDLGSTR
jgi:uncharacterized protein (TIGR03382 family)